MDNYVEQIVETKADGEAYAKVIGSIVLAVLGVIITLCTVYTGWGILLFAVGLFLGYIAKNHTNLEYEYEITNGDISIDKIFNKESRKNAVSFVESDIQRVFVFTSEKFQNELDINKELVVKDFTSKDESKKDDWYAFIVNDKKSTMAVVIEANEKSKAHIESHFKKRIER